MVCKTFILTIFRVEIIYVRTLHIDTGVSIGLSVINLNYSIKQSQDFYLPNEVLHYMYLSS